MADAATRKRKLQELEDKLGKIEETLKGHGSRPDMVELRFEESQQYRFLRNENSPARVMSKVVRWNARPSEHPQHCFCQLKFMMLLWICPRQAKRFFKPKHQRSAEESGPCRPTTEFTLGEFVASGPAR